MGDFFVVAGKTDGSQIMWLIEAGVQDGILLFLFLWGFCKGEWFKIEFWLFWLFNQTVKKTCQIIRKIEQVWFGWRFFNVPLTENNSFSERPVGNGTHLEAWIVSDMDQAATVVKEGQLKGKNLKEIYHQYPDGFDTPEKSEFPLLVKLIDARDNLSVQVHPEDAYAQSHENQSCGKNECWHILDCGKNGQIQIGHHAKTKEELADLIDRSQWEQLLDYRAIKPGDFLNIPAGTVHAICRNTLLLEVQQASDLTYRLYDYDRLSNGKPRELHLAQAKDVIVCPAPKQSPEQTEGDILVDTSYFKVRELKGKDKILIETQPTFQIGFVVDGEGVLQNRTLHRWDTFLVPANMVPLVLTGHLHLILAQPK